MVNYMHFVGIDLSKLTFDAAVIINGQKEGICHKQFKKTEDGLRQFQEWLKDLGVVLNPQTLVCMEFTGLYNRMVLNFLGQTDVSVWVEMAVHIKRSLGLQRDKSDKLDAVRIALFAWRNQDEARIWGGMDTDSQTIKDLLAQRERMVDTKGRLMVPLEEMKGEGLVDAAKQLEAYQKPVITQLDNTIDKIEQAIKDVVKNNEKLKSKSAIVQSVKGIGLVICWHLIAFTNGFEHLKDGKSLACYCGVVPFKKT